MPRVESCLLTCDQELRGFHATWLKQKEEERKEAAEIENRKWEGQWHGAVAEALTGIGRSAGFGSALRIPLAPGVHIGVPSISRDTSRTSISHGVKNSSGTFFNIPSATTCDSSSTLSISTVSDLGEEIEERVERVASRHDMFYFEDGNVEIVCGGTVFRVHSTISFSSPKLQDVFSPYTLLHAPMPEGCPRITFKDSPEDFAALLKMIYTPGCVPAPHDVSFVS